jgi:tetratricopeptide (TPR) repeat protein
VAVGCVAVAALSAIAICLVGWQVARSQGEAKRTASLRQHAYALTARGEFEAAIPVLTELLQAKLSVRDRAYAVGERGWAYMNVDRNADAIRDFDAALELKPDLVFALLDRGLVLHREGKLAAARA